MSVFGKLTQIWSQDMAIDLGTANTLVVLKGQGVVLNEPSVVAVVDNKGKKSVLAVGDEAKTMLGRTPGNIQAIRPLRDGVIADFIVTEEMIKHFIKKVHKRSSFANPRILICVPTGSTPVERKAIQDSALAAGARRVQLIEEPIAAAIGAGLPISEATGSMVIDIGGGTTEIAVISLGGIVCDKSIRVAGDEFTDNIKTYMKTRHNIAVGDIMAEQIKINVGSALTELDDPPPNYAVHGRDLMSGIPKEIIVTYKEIAGALNNSIEQIEEAVMGALFQTPPALSADIYNEGLYLTGGGSMLRGLDKRISKKTKLPVYVAEDPLRAVARGTGIALKNTESYTFLIR